MKKNIINFFCFTAIVIALLIGVNSILLGIKDSTDLRFSLFYEEDVSSLDLINIGASTTRCGFIPASAYEKYDIKSYNYCLDSLPFELIPYMIEECEKYQDGCTYTIDINSINYLNQPNAKFYAQPFVGNLKDTKQKNKILKELFNESSDWVSNLSLYNVHSNWQKLGDAQITNQKEFSKKSYLKGWGANLKQAEHLDIIETNNENNYTLKEEQTKALDKLIETINKFECKVIFYTFPKIITDIHMLKEEQIAQKVQEYLEQKGMNVLHTEGIEKQLNLNDFYDFCHMNIDGAEKYTNLMVNSLINEFNLNAKEQTPEQKNEWNKQIKLAKKYLQKINKEFKNGKNIKTNEMHFRKDKNNIK